MHITAAILEEANIAFELNTGLFTTLKPPSRARTPESPVPAVLGDPTSPTVEASIPPILIKEGLESKVVYDADTKPAATRMLPLSSVLAFILALCASHFLLVLGGFTGIKGYAKLEAVFGWITSPFLTPS